MATAGRLRFWPTDVSTFKQHVLEALSKKATASVLGCKLREGWLATKRWQSVKFHPAGKNTVVVFRTGIVAEAESFSKRGRAIHVDFRSGVGDIVATVGGRTVIAECKGGIVNTRHNGQRSRLRRGLCETAGQLIGREQKADERHVAVVPYTALTETVAKRMAYRAGRAGVEIALVRADGRVSYVPPREPGVLHR